MAKVQPEAAEKELTHSPCWCRVTTCFYCPCICMKACCPGKLEPLKKHYMEPEAGASSRAQTGASDAEVFIPATDEGKILFVGRHSVKGTAKEFDQICTAFRFEVTGPCKAVWMEMSGRLFAHREKLAQCKTNEFGINCPGMMKSYVNGRPVKRMVIADGDTSGGAPRQYLLAEDLPAGQHTIHVSKCSEFFFGALTLHGIVVSEGCEVNAPQAKKVVEIISDSNSAMPGNVGPNTYDFTASKKLMMKWTDTDLAWFGHLNTALDVDTVMVGASGMGFAANAEEVGHGPMIDIYCRVCQNEEAEYKEGDAMNPVDLCIIYLGMNDWGLGFGGMAGKDQEAIAGYKKLIDLVRARRGPSVPILCLYPDATTVGGAPNLTTWSRMIQKGFHVHVKRWVTGAVALTGGEDAKIFARQVNPTRQISAAGDDDFGMECHLNVDGGQKFSTGVIPLVRDIMGWPVVGADSVPAPLKM